MVLGRDGHGMTACTAAARKPPACRWRAQSWHQQLAQPLAAYQRDHIRRRNAPDWARARPSITSIPADPNVKNYTYTAVDGQVYYRENSRHGAGPNCSAAAEEPSRRAWWPCGTASRQLIALPDGKRMPDAAPSGDAAGRAEPAATTPTPHKYGLLNSRGNA